MERPSMIKDLAREIQESPLGNVGDELVRLITENDMKVMVENTWNRMSNKLMNNSKFSAGVIVIKFILPAIKKSIEVTISGTALDSMYG